MKHHKNKITISILRAKWNHFQSKQRKKIDNRSLFLWCGISFLGCITLGALMIYALYLSNLPSIETLETNALEQSSIVYDRNGKELYRFFTDENRIILPIENISTPIQQALISTEDKNFFQNDGIDYRGLVRSVVNFITGKTEKIQGTSTISQQLIRNFFLSNERSFARKIKEIYLSFQLNDTYSKNKILELYLNKISYGNNAAGVESASQVYFGKSAKDVGYLGATILASLPKGPSYYSPYTHRDRLIGEISLISSGGTTPTIELSTHELRSQYYSAILAFKNKLQKLTIIPASSTTVKICNGADNCETVAYQKLLQYLSEIQVILPKLSGEKIPQDLENITVQYTPGRKDFVAGRLFEDKKITPEQYLTIISDGIDFEFRPYREKIEAPHFVFYVKEYLETTFQKDLESLQGLKIYTTLDLDLQKKAEAFVKKRAKENATKHGAKGAALISIDNANGQILAFVGSPDYFDKEAGGQVNMLTAKRQPGSTFKPIIYAQAIARNPISPETPIYDVDTTFGKWNPDNYDRKFLGRMDVRHALDYSRNIPAVKMFYLAGGEASIVAHAQKLGIGSIVSGKDYGAPLAIGTGEMKPIELAQAYSVFANNGILRPIQPILSIVDAQGNTILKPADTSKTGSGVFSAAASYIISTILSDTSARPTPFWNQFLALKDRIVAAKTGTSNVDVSKNGKKSILPRDLWTAGYTPQYTTVVWVGNPDGSPTKGSCDGLNCAASIWFDFMTEIHKGKPALGFTKPKEITTATISRLTGKLASETTPEHERVSSIFAVKPTKYEGKAQEVEVDSLCNGVVTEQTPPDAIKKLFLIESDGVIDGFDQAWRKGITNFQPSSNESTLPDTLFALPSKTCERPQQADAIIVSSNIADASQLLVGPQKITIQFQSQNPIAQAQVLFGSKVVYQQKITGSGSSALLEFTLQPGYTSYGSMSIKVIDTYGYSGELAINGSVVTEIPPPTITMTSPQEGDSTLSIYEDEFANLRFIVQSPLPLANITIYRDSELIKLLPVDQESFVYAVNQDEKLIPGEYTFKIQAQNEKRSKSSKSIRVTILKR